MVARYARRWREESLQLENTGCECCRAKLTLKEDPLFFFPFGNQNVPSQALTSRCLHSCHVECWGCVCEAEVPKEFFLQEMVWIPKQQLI